MSVSTAERKAAAKAAKEFRRAKNMPQWKLAEKLGTHQSIVSEAERGYPTVPPKLVRKLLELSA